MQAEMFGAAKKVQLVGGPCYVRQEAVIGAEGREEEAAGLHEFVFVTAMMDLQKEDMQELVNLWPHNDCCQC